MFGFENLTNIQTYVVKYLDAENPTHYNTPKQDPKISKTNGVYFMGQGVWDQERTYKDIGFYLKNVNKDTMAWFKTVTNFVTPTTVP